MRSWIIHWLVKYTNILICAQMSSDYENNQKRFFIKCFVCTCFHHDCGLFSLVTVLSLCPCEATWEPEPDFCWKALDNILIENCSSVKPLLHLFIFSFSEKYSDSYTLDREDSGWDDRTSCSLTHFLSGAL